MDILSKITPPLPVLIFATKVLAITSFITFLATCLLGVIRSNFVKKFILRTSSETTKQPSIILSSNQISIKGTFYVSEYAKDPSQKALWLNLVDANTKTFGYYHGKTVKEGFADIVGERKTVGNIPYILITKLTPSK